MPNPKASSSAVAKKTNASSSSTLAVKDADLFLDAIQNDREVIFSKLIKKDGYVNAVVKQKCHPVIKVIRFGEVTPLFWAVLNEKVACIETLLEKGAHPNAQVKISAHGKEGFTTPFTYALERYKDSGNVSYFDMISTMLKYSADRGGKLLGMPFLHYVYTQLALSIDQLKLLTTLAIADSALATATSDSYRHWLDERDSEGKTLLYRCIEGKKFQQLKLLLELGANPNKTFSKVYNNHPHEFSPLRFATEGNQEEMVKALLHAGANVNQLSGPGEGSSVLHMAAVFNHTNLVNLFLKVDGIDINIPGVNKGTPLYAAIQHASVDAVIALLSHNASLNIFNDAGNSAIKVAELFYAKDHLEARKLIKEKIIEAAHQIDSQEKYDEEASIVQIFLTMKDRAGKMSTPLQLLNKLFSTFKSADINEIDKVNNCTLLDVAVSLESEDMVKWLLSRGALVYKARDAIARAATYENSGMLGMLLEKNKTEQESCLDKKTDAATAICFAVQSNNLMAVNLLISYGCNPNIFTDLGQNALHISLGRGYDEISCALIQYEKTDINMLAMNQETPLMIAFQSDSSPDVIARLIKAGAVVDERSCLLPTGYGSFPVLPIIVASGLSPDVFRILCKYTRYELLISSGPLDNALFLLSVFSNKVINAGIYLSFIEAEDKLAIIEKACAIAKVFNNKEMLDCLLQYKSTLISSTIIPTMSDNVIPVEQPVEYTDSTPVKMSGKAYLKSKGFTEEQVNLLVAVNQPKKIMPKQGALQSDACLFSGSERKQFEPDSILHFPTFSLSLGSLQKVNGKENCWHYLAEYDLKSQLCSEVEISKFQQAQSSISNGESSGIKFISVVGGKKEIAINGTVIPMELSHELKIKGSPARLLGFSLLANDGRTTVYFSYLYLANGLHEMANVKSLASNSKVFSLNVPDPMQATSSVAPSKK